MSNQFADTYKKLSTSKLLDIIENGNDYQPIAIETAKAELANRIDIEEAKIELKEKNIEQLNKISEQNKKRQEISDKALKLLEYADPLIEKSPEKSVLILCIGLLLMFIYQTITSFNMLIFAFREVAHGDLSIYWFLIEYFFLPFTIFFLWKKTKTGWTMLLIWLIYSILFDSVSLYAAFQMRDMLNEPFMQFIPLPTMSAHLFTLAFHAGLLYFICKSNVKELFKKREKTIVEDEVN